MRFNYLHACRLSTCKDYRILKETLVRASHSGSVHSSSTETIIIYICGASQTPSMHVVVVSLGLLYYNVHLGMQRAPFHQICKVNNL